MAIMVRVRHFAKNHCRSSATRRGRYTSDSDIDAKDIKYINNNPRSFNNRLSAKENLQYFYAISSENL